MTPSYKGILLNLKYISTKNKQYQVYSNNIDLALISLGKLCDDGYIVVANKNKLIAYKY